MSKNTLGFTLAELLSALAILGVIATFTIPKVLTSSQNGQSNAMGKEAMASLSQMHLVAQLNGTLSSTTTGIDILNSLNYIKTTTTGNLDQYNGFSSIDCAATTPCYFLANGGAIRAANESFGGTDGLRALRFWFDPDGEYSGSTTGASKSLQIFVYYNGRVRTRGTIEPNTVSSTATSQPSTTADPTWLVW